MARRPPPPRGVHSAIRREAWSARADKVEVTHARHPHLAALADAARHAWACDRRVRHVTYSGKRYGLRVTNLGRLLVFDPATDADLVGVFVEY